MDIDEAPLRPVPSTEERGRRANTGRRMRTFFGRVLESFEIPPARLVQRRVVPRFPSIIEAVYEVHNVSQAVGRLSYELYRRWVETRS